MKSNDKNNRLKGILDYLIECGGASVKDIAQHMNVSEMTARRDLYSLKEQNLILYISGVAIYNINQARTRDDDYQLSHEQSTNNERKSRIGIKAASLIRPGDTIIIDTGSTTEELARHFPDISPCTVLCYNANIFNYLSTHADLNILMTGGSYHRNTQMFECPEGISFIRRTRANMFFLSAAGISDLLGITCVNQYEIEVKQASMQVAQQKILLADSSKFGKIRPALFAQISEIDTVVTDSDITPEWVEVLEQHGIEVLTC